MQLFIRPILGLAAGGLVMVMAAQPAQAAPPARPNVAPAVVRPATIVPATVRPAAQPYVYPQYNGSSLFNGGSRPIGWDWWRTYPYSNYNAWRNSYWYLPYNANYLYSPSQAYPYYNPALLPPVPELPPIPQPWGISSYR
jgi:hypothetical protein